MVFKGRKERAGRMRITAREYLEQYKALEARVRILQAEVERIRTDAEGLHINLDATPKGSGKNDKLARLAIMLAERETELQEELTKAWSVRIDIVKNLEALQDHKQQTLLYAKYIEGKTWETIAYEMGYTWRHCHRIHGRALQKLESIIN